MSLELMLAALLRYGTWLASVVIATGLVIEGLAAGSGMRVVAAGVGLFILLPVMRVLLMLGVFARCRDYRLVAVTMVVLVTILAGVVIGMCMSDSRALAH